MLLVELSWNLANFGMNFSWWMINVAWSSELILIVLKLTICRKLKSPLWRRVMPNVLDLGHWSVNTTTVRSAIEKTAWRETAPPFGHLWYRPSPTRSRAFPNPEWTQLELGTSWIRAQSNVRLFRRRPLISNFKVGNLLIHLPFEIADCTAQFVFYWLAMDNDRIDRWLKLSWFHDFFLFCLFHVVVWEFLIGRRIYFRLFYFELFDFELRPLFLLHCRIPVFMG
jgi:hypothetical protein